MRRHERRRGGTPITCGGTHRRPIPYLRLGLFALLLAMAIGIFIAYGRHISLQSLAEHRMALKALVFENYALALIAYIVTYILAVILMFPTAMVFTLAGGFLFGWAVGAAVTLVAATSGATIAFLLARTTLGETFAQRSGRWLCKLQTGFQKDAFSYLLFLRLVPAFPFWVMNLAPAVLGMRLRDFIAATALGIVPGTLAFSFVGSGLGKVLARAHKAYIECLDLPPVLGSPCRFDLQPSAFITPQLITAFLLIGVIALLPVIAKRLWKSKASRA